MNGFTWSAKGDLVPVSCRNAVSNTSPRSAKARIYYPTRRGSAGRERAGRPSLNYLVGAAFLFILPNDPDKPTIKARAGRIAARTGRTSANDLVSEAAVQIPRRWPRLDVNLFRIRERWLRRRRCAETLTFVDRLYHVREMVLARVSWNFFLRHRFIFLIHWTVRGDKKTNFTRNKVILEDTY